MSIDYAAYIRDVGMLEAVDVHSASHWRKQVHARNVGNLSELGDKLPWSKTHGKFQLREGEVTVWAGYDGARKSMILGQIMAHISFAKKVAIASLEMRPEATLLRMCRQIAGHKPTTSIINKFLDHGENNILIYDQLDMVEEDKLLGFIHYSASKLNCKHIVIDSLTKLAFPDNDRTAEIRFINRLQYFAQALNVHIHLVCHCRKPQMGDESKLPNKTEIRGASQITNLAHNVVLTWANKKKARAQEKLNEGKPLDQKELDSLSKPDQFLIVDKQREGEWEGIFALWFELSSTQFLGQEGHKKFRYEKITN
tara:strand:- start:770 stop:1702 length:933 start_codon:yes stop_codon:yes gene_type:complete